MAPFPICHSEAAAASDLINIYTVPFNHANANDTRGDAETQPAGSEASAGRCPGPVTWGSIPQLRGLPCARPGREGAPREGAPREGAHGRGAEPAPPPPGQGEQDVEQAVTSYPSPLSL